MKVSIICVSYNTADYVRKSIDSLLHQTLKEIEIIAIDNGSSDNSIEVFQEYAKKDSRVKCYDMEECLGVQRDLGGVVGNTDYSACINYGLHLAQGEYVYILDCDDWLDLHALKVLYNKAKEERLDVLAFNPKIEYENEKMADRYRGHSDYFKRSTPFEQVATGKEFMSYCEEHGEYLVNVFLYLMNREFLEQHRIRMNYFGGDILFTFQLYLTAKRVSLYNEPFHHYLMREKSGTELLHGNDCYAYRRYQITYTEMLSLFFYHKCSREKDPHIYKLIQTIFVYFSHHLMEVKPNHAISTMLNIFEYENLLLGDDYSRIRVSKEEIRTNRKKKNNLCFFGAGDMNVLAFDFFKENQLDLPCVICDNNKTVHGTEICGVPVMSFEQAREEFSDLHYLITNYRYCTEIMFQIGVHDGFRNIWFYNFFEEEIPLPPLS